MIGWRARIGILSPSVNVVTATEINRILPDGVSIHTTRMFIEKNTVKGLIAMDENIERAAKEISTLNPTIVAYACTSGSLIKGVGFDREIINKIKSIVKVPVTTTSTAVVKALKNFNAEKISVVTPYIKEIDDEEKAFLEAHGFEVLNIKGMGILEAADLSEVPPYNVYRFAKKACYPKSDVLFVSCCNFRTFEVIDALEKDLGIPVISSNQATAWDVFNLAKVNERINGYGKLLEG